MSRIGENPITIPEGVSVSKANGVITVKGTIGELLQEIVEGIKVNIQEKIITIERSSNQKEQRSLHGLYRALIANMIEGVSKGYTKKLELVGVGYRASNQGQKLDISVGFSHNIIFEVPEEVKVSCESEKGKAPVIIFDDANINEVVELYKKYINPNQAQIFSILPYGKDIFSSAEGVYIYTDNGKN